MSKKSIVKPVNRGVSKKRLSRSKSLKSGAKSLKSSFTQIDRKEDTVIRKIYETEKEPNKENDKRIIWITFLVISKFQYALVVYLLVATGYELFFGDDGSWKYHLGLLILETMAYIVTLFFNPKKFFITQYRASATLVLQYILAFHNLSEYLQSNDYSKKSWLDSLLNYSGITFYSALIHFFLVMQSIEYLGETSGLSDFSEEIIVESAEKREGKLGKMIKELVDQIMEEDGDFHILFGIKDETGRRESMDGAGVEGEITRNFEMYSDGNFIELTRNNTTVTRVDPAEDPNENVEESSVEYTVGGPESKFNSCFKQEKPFSPMKIL